MANKEKLGRKPLDTPRVPVTFMLDTDTKDNLIKTGKLIRKNGRLSGLSKLLNDLLAAVV